MDESERKLKMRFIEVLIITTALIVSTMSAFDTSWVKESIIGYSIPLVGVAILYYIFLIQVKNWEGKHRFFFYMVGFFAAFSFSAAFGLAISTISTILKGLMALSYMFLLSVFIMLGLITRKDFKKLISRFKKSF